MASEPARVQQTIGFGEDFELDVRAYELRRGGRVLKLPPIPMDILIFLVEQRDRLVSREQIVERVWGNGVFLDTDNSINGAIRKIRQALRDDSDQPRFIQTFAGRGYRFIAPVIETGSKAEPAAVSLFPGAENLIGKKISHYRVLQLLGGGGMGVVFKAEDLKLGRQVAMKFLPGELASDPAAFERLQREARAASALDHPKICSIHELGEHEGRPFIVMQLLEGRTLREWIETAAKGSAQSRLDQVLDFAIQILDGLDAAHQKGIIHRDIKPANIFITSRGEAKILDFGVAKIIDAGSLPGHTIGASNTDVVQEETLGHKSDQERSDHQDRAKERLIILLPDANLTRTGVSMGTPAYLSPEQVRHQALDARTDIFSFGLVLYEMATGQRAFPGETAVAIRDAVLHQPVVPARKLNPEVPPELEKIIEKSLEKDRERRYRTAAQMKLDLEHLSGGPGERAGAWWRRARLRRVGLAAVLLLIAGAVFLIANPKKPPNVPFATVKTTRLTSAGKSFKAAISPDGRYIAHTLLASGKESLRVRQATSLDDRELVAPQAVRYLGIVFSPDSEMVYYILRGTENKPGTLFRVPVIGGSPQKLMDDLISSIAPSPDGKRFGFVRESATESTLLVADFDSGDEQKLISRKLPEVLDYPAWSPDGSIIACTDTDSSLATPTGSKARIIQVRVSDKREQVLSPQTWGFVRQLAWLSDGTGLVMSARGSEESGTYHLWYVSYPQGEGRQITEGIDRQVGASVPVASREIVTVQEKTFSSIWRMLGGGKNPVLVASGESGTSAPIWAPDRRIVFEEELEGHRSIWIVDANGGNRRQLTHEGNNYDHSVSGDGRKLAFISDRSSVPAIWTMDLEGGKPLMVTTATGESVPELSPDGKWIVFAAIGSEHWTTLWRVNSGGGYPVELNKKQWWRPVTSPDGKWIAGFYADHPIGTQTLPTSMAVIASDGGRPSKIIPIPASVSQSAGIRWSRDSRRLTYVDERTDGSNIFSQSLDDSPPHQITRFQGVDLFSFDWSADGTELAFSRGILTRDVVLIEDAQRK